ncbi:hypothetical protein HNR77_001945 [Paenibacillus sp. JGP012]|uniref:hypothetical protein n=1 Tax=Paenibacillus sp. JGP012 TaxID=2735914 RepID=UPI001618B387|nr:hypothetical protein [Paenibacillus sp. JGP012]MBB6020883.1 hypothetical protein [Paenibacillus sp. JGP012]
MNNQNSSDWNKPFKDIDNFNDFIDVIKNWGNLYDDWEEYNIYGMIAILSASLDNIERNFLDDEIEGLYEHLNEKQLDFLIKVGKLIEKKL